MVDDQLKKYRDKRDFTKTPEPQAGEASDGAPTFVVQKHDARRLHYDVRFEVDGVMPSWAVPKGPSYDPKSKRLAMQTEDHPLDYQTFEGVIPEGEYGGGAVIVWDNGTYRNITEKNGKQVPMREAIESGHFSVWIEGVKLKGGWSFTRTGGDADKPAWIMVKRKDEYADPSVEITEVAPDSVDTGKSLDDIADEPDAKKWTRAMATFRPPMLAKLSEKLPVGDDWIYERKLDGLRCVAVRNGDDIQLWSRNHLSFNARFPNIIDALKALPADNFVIDGELVAFSGAHTSFSLLQQGKAGTTEMLYAFDLLHLLGKDTTEIPLTQRKELLAKAVVPSQNLAVVESLDGDPQELLTGACHDGWEGLIAKKPDSLYVSGRSSSWLKLKCTASQELVIGGWTEPRGTRVGFGALLVGYYENRKFRYAGKVGTGFDDKLLRSLYADLLEREVDESPFVDPVKEKTAHWAKPELVANIGFAEWTGDGKLRHPRFQGVRTDKTAKSVKREKK